MLQKLFCLLPIRHGDSHSLFCRLSRLVCMSCMQRLSVCFFVLPPNDVVEDNNFVSTFDPLEEELLYLRIEILFDLVMVKKVLYDNFCRSTGPIVRVAPNEIDICDTDIVYQMYKSGSGFLKSEWYNKLTINGVKNIFSARDPKSHSRRRRLLSAPLSDSSLQSMHPTINAKSKLAVQRMRQN
ncbi:unnamed protein product [Penicillium egyptiacum]|uniref:Cytochrome P450 n=1 Tax=Penicillium egyptiacum TaxID=1303716 RepID=A0A9W4PB98_9EURO|nr:unnamed protein product [Penicillium egyptiacum]